MRLVTVGGHFAYHMKMAGFDLPSIDSQIDKPQRGHPKRAELPDENINTGTQSINSETESLMVWVGDGGGWVFFSSQRRMS